jgi:T5SS/PEP-CTERM-associated repeat protein
MFVLVSGISNSYAQTRIWNVAGTGSWNVAGNWINGVPNAGVDAHISNGGTAQLPGTSGAASGLYLGVGASSSGSLTISRSAVPGVLASTLAFVGHSGANSTVNVTGLESNWTNSGNLIVGYQGVGTLNVQNEATVLSGSAILGDFGTGDGLATVGVGSRWTNTGELRVGNQGVGSLLIGGRVTNNAGYIGYSNAVPNKSGSVSVSGAGAEWTSASDLYVGFSGKGTLSVSSGGKVTSNKAAIGYHNTSNGKATISGPGSIWITSGFVFDVGTDGTGTLEILNGGTLSTNTNAIVGFLSNGNGAVEIAGTGSTWTNTGVVTIGQSGTGKLTVKGGGSLNTTSDLIVGSSGTLNILGGTIAARSLVTTTSGGTFNFQSGTIHLTSDQVLVPDSDLGKVLSADPTFVGEKHLVLDGTATLYMPLELDGGSISVGQLVNASHLDLQRGTLNLTNQAVTVQAGGLFGDRLRLEPGVTINVFSGVTNHGLIEGSGILGGPLTNATDGEIRATAGNSLTFTGASATNSGDIRLIGGLAEFAGPLTNTATGRITGRGTFSAGGAGLTNNGHIALSSGISDVFGDVVNDTANASRGITVSGNADVTFWDDVNNVAGSLFRVSDGSSATFFGTYSGAGISGLGGNVYFEADVTPGASPAIASFDGNVSFGPASSLAIELGGTVAGSQYDRIVVGGQLALGGTLEISLINGFVPTAGQTFDFLVGSNVVGAFSSVELPSLPGLTWDRSQLATGMLTVLPDLPGDFNHNGVVDGADYVIWRKNPGGVYTQNDYNIWRAHFGQTLGSGSAGYPQGASVEPRSAAVPEPTTVAIASLAFGLSVLRSRKLWSEEIRDARLKTY